MHLPDTTDPSFRRLLERTENLQRTMNATNRWDTPAEYPAMAMLRTAVCDLVRKSGKGDTAALLNELAAVINGVK